MLNRSKKSSLAELQVEAAKIFDSKKVGKRINRADWAQKYIILDKEKFSFDGYEYQKEIYECEAKTIILEKAAQMGGTLWGIIDALWALDTDQVKVAMYYFPVESDALDFSHDRVTPIILAHKHLYEQMYRIDNVKLKQFMNPITKVKRGSLYLRGMHGRASTSSVPADQLMVDERDKVLVREYELVLKRLSGSKVGNLREACTPTVPGYGINASFLKSDQRYWHIKCESCGTWNQPEITFREDDNLSRVLYKEDSDKFAYLGCKTCRRRIDPATGEWVALFPENEYRAVGFHLSQLWSQVVQSGIPLQEIIYRDFSETRYLEDFHNSRIGIPYEDSNTSITLDVLDDCDGTDGFEFNGRGCTMGVDQGKQLHVVISRYVSDIRHIIYVAVIDDFETLDTLMEDYGVVGCVIDAYPNQHSARDFAKRFPGKVHCCHYSRHQKKEISWKDEEQNVLVGRTEQLDACQTPYTRNKVVLPREQIMEDMFKPQMCNIVRKPIRDNNDMITGYEYVARGADHFRHADLYDQLAATRRNRDYDEILKGVQTMERRETAGLGVVDDPFVGDDNNEMEKW